MANVTNIKGPFTIDTVDTITTERVLVKSIVVVASSDAPTVVLNDKDGNEVFRDVPAAATVRTRTSDIGPTIWNGITAATLTNVTRVFVYPYSKSV